MVSRTIYCGVRFRIRIIFPRYSPMMPSTIRINPEKTTMAQIVEDQPTITVGLMSFRMAIMMAARKPPAAETPPRTDDMRSGITE